MAKEAADRAERENREAEEHAQALERVLFLKTFFDQNFMKKHDFGAKFNRK